MSLPGIFPPINNPVINDKLGDIRIQNSTTALQSLLRVLIDLTFAFAGLYFFITILRGGYEFITAGPDKEAVQRAQKRLTNGFMGIIIVFGFYALVFIIETVFGIDIIYFNIPRP